MRRPQPKPPCRCGETEVPGGEGHAESQHGPQAGSWYGLLPPPTRLERQEQPQDQLIGPADWGNPKKEAALPVTLSQPRPQVALSPSPGYSGQSDPAAPGAASQAVAGQARGIGGNTAGSAAPPSTVMAWGGEGLQGPSPGDLHLAQDGGGGEAQATAPALP